MSKIPKIIHLCCKTKKIPKVYRGYVTKMMTLHPNWEFYIHDDFQMSQIVEQEFPEYLEVYNSYSFDIQRVDFFRILIVYLVGGFYVDLDMSCHKALDNLCNKSIVLGEERVCTKEETLELSLTNPMQIANYMFGSVPRHDFFKLVINEMVEKSSTIIRTENDVLKSTGPAVLTNIYHTTKMQFKEIEIIKNNGRICSRWCQRPSCHFGDYAAHMHLGSWRWENNKV